MLISIDIRRVPGGLQLTVGDTWRTRLNYDQADELLTALSADTPAYLGGVRDVALAYLPNYPEAGEGTLARFDGKITDDLRHMTCVSRTDLHAMRDLGELLRAHMPDRLPPLPGGIDSPWPPALPS
ncbi:hypothetical protein L3Q67_45195 (plasmid) [Saccharothrix sp. AJ9571]|nr:hypothetical protein L3Q67_45195 [Saccharothrix sp. AJ9571]